MFINGKTDPQTIVRLQEQLKIHNHLYKELLRSKPYRLARLGELFLHAFTQAQSRRKFLRMAQDLWRGYRSRQKYPLLSVCPDNPAKGAYFSNENFIVYTAIFGAYDLPQEPLFVPDNCSFYIFTDQPVAENSVWKKCPTDFLGPQFAQLSNPYKNRFCKMFPHKLFPQAKHSIYLDGNIMPITDLTEFITLLSAYGLLTHAHKSRRCVYDEINACKYVKKAIPPPWMRTRLI